MLYQRSLEIERRLEAVLGMIRMGSYSTPQLAEELGVSIPTISRDVTALRQRGYDIRAERGADGWRYRLVDEIPAPRERNLGIASPSARNRSPGRRT